MSPNVGNSGQISRFHNAQVSSFGGCGTTWLCQYLQTVDVALPREVDYGIWKHMRQPPVDSAWSLPRGYKAIYLFGNPMNSVLSIFRRGLQYEHAKRIGQGERFFQDATFEEYLENRNDEFGLEEHFDNWAFCPADDRRFPIMLIKYETLWQHVPEICEFLELSHEARKNFPRPSTRASDWTCCSPEIREKLLAIHGSLAAKTDLEEGGRII